MLAHLDPRLGMVSEYDTTAMMAFLHLEAGHDLVAPCGSEQRRRNEWYLYWVYKMA